MGYIGAKGAMGDPGIPGRPGNYESCNKNWDLIIYKDNV